MTIELARKSELARATTNNSSGTQLLNAANLTITTTDGIEKIFVTTGVADRTITLPAAASSVGRSLKIIKMDNGTGAVIMDGEGAETINGNTTIQIVRQYEETNLICDGTLWIADYESEVLDLSTGTSSFTTLDAVISKRGAVVTLQGIGVWDHASLATIGTGDALFPARYRPSDTVYNAYRVTSVWRSISILASGQIFAAYASARSDTEAAVSVTWIIT